MPVFTVFTVDHPTKPAFSKRENTFAFSETEERREREGERERESDRERESER